MQDQKPTIGRIVHYKPTEAQNEHWRNTVGYNTAEVLPAMVVAVWSETCVNLKVITDGDRNLWVTSSQLGEGSGQWHWPARQ